MEDTLAPFYDNLQTITLHCGPNLDVTQCLIDGKRAAFTRNGEILSVTPNVRTVRGKQLVVQVHYSGSKRPNAGRLVTDSGWHFIEPNGRDANREGFWTQGETQENRYWAPMWDYPNDFATSETITTVPNGWTVIGNGSLVSAKTNPAGTKTYHWKMSQPHATYLLSLVGGPMDIKKSSWNGVELMYAVPKGMGDKIDASFAVTPKLLEFFSNLFGVKYPWVKYAQSCMYDFGGGMENVSATTLGVGGLGRSMDGLIAHEMGHQWFGDLVTCKTWGDIWLNEGFATYCDALWTEHKDGKEAYIRDIQGNFNGYVRDTRNLRAVATKMYSNGDAMFDGQSYSKGSVILHMLRRYVGDKAFFEGIKNYLTQYRHQNVETDDFRQVMSRTSGKDLEAWFAQWVYKPGHLVLQTSWTYKDGKVDLKLNQKQDPTKGTLYEFDTVVAIKSGASVVRKLVHVSGAETAVSLPSGVKPDSVEVDPDRDLMFVRQD